MHIKKVWSPPTAAPDEPNAPWENGMPHTDPEVSMLRNMYNCTKQTSIFLLTHNSRNIGAGYPIRRTMRLMEVNEQKYVFDAFVKCTDHACGFFYYYYFTDNSKSLSNRERY